LSPSTTIHWISRYTRNREYFGTRWKRGKVLCVYSKHNNGKARSIEDHGASPSLWKEYYLKTRQSIQVGSGKLNTSNESLSMVTISLCTTYKKGLRQCLSMYIFRWFQANDKESCISFTLEYMYNVWIAWQVEKRSREDHGASPSLCSPRFLCLLTAFIKLL
jgi:hypothetical protein